MNKVWRLAGRVLRPIGAIPIAIYLHNTQRTRVIVVHNNAVLVVMPWLSNGKWDLPGGGLKQGENPSEGAVRELHEELGLIIAPKDVTVLGIEPFKAGLVRYTAIYVSVTLSKPVQFNTLQKHEIVAVRWVTEADLTTLPMMSPRLAHNAQAVLRAQQGRDILE